VAICEVHPALWNLVDDQKASLKHLKEHERERTGYKQMTVILQEVRNIQSSTSCSRADKDN